MTLDSIKGTYTGCVIFLKFQKKLGVIMEWFLTKKLYVFSHIDLHTLVGTRASCEGLDKGQCPSSA